MDKWQKVPVELASRFDAALPEAADVQRRQMFGCPCAFVNNNMFAGLHQDRLVVRVPEEAARHPCVIMGRTMKQYALIDEALSLGPELMAQWIARGYGFTRAMAPKPAKPKASSTKVPARPR